MPLVISDEMLKAAQLDEREARVEIACRLFDAGKLTLPLAARFAELPRAEFEGELLRRNIPVYRLRPGELEQEVAAMEKAGE